MHERWCAERRRRRPAGQLPGGDGLRLHGGHAASRGTFRICRIAVTTLGLLRTEHAVTSCDQAPIAPPGCCRPPARALAAQLPRARRSTALMRNRDAILNAGLGVQVQGQMHGRGLTA